MTEGVLYLTGLAQDVLDHAKCEGCRINAAAGLDHLGLLDETLARTGAADPRQGSGPWAPAHLDRPMPVARDRETVYDLTIRFALPEVATKEACRNAQHRVTEAAKAALVAQGAVVFSMASKKAAPPS